MTLVVARQPEPEPESSHDTVGPFTVLKFEDQTFISHIYYRREPTFTTDSEANF